MKSKQPSIEIGDSIKFNYQGRIVIAEATKQNIKVLSKLSKFQYCTVGEAALLKSTGLDSMDYTDFRRKFNKSPWNS